MLVDCQFCQLRDGRVPENLNHLAHWRRIMRSEPTQSPHQLHVVQRINARIEAQCGIIEVASVDHMVRYGCSRDATAQCFDCFIPMCDAHTEHCKLCNQTFCSTCLGFHKREQH